MKSPKILIVDDEIDILDLLSYNLEKQGYLVKKSNSAQKALNMMIEEIFDLVILDIMMPGMDGYTLCKKIRNVHSINQNVPIIFLSAKDTEIDEILGLELGADDFLVKPVSMNKLLARIKSNIRKKIEVVNSSISWGAIEANKDTRSVYINSVKIMFTKTEFDILYLLMSKEGKVFKRDELLNFINEDTVVLDRVIDVHIKKIRDKLLNYKNIIVTVHGIGYSASKEILSEKK